MVLIMADISAIGPKELNCLVFCEVTHKNLVVAYNTRPQLCDGIGSLLVDVVLEVDTLTVLWV